MQWIKTAEFPADQDLSGVNRRLRNEGVVHRFTMEASGQVLWLGDRENAAEVLEKVRYWIDSGDTLGEQPAEQNRSGRKIFEFSAKPAPLTLALIALSFVGAGLYAFGDRFILPFTFWIPDPYTPESASIFRDIGGGEYWRLITPIFIHFNPTHSIFNALWLWYLGTMVERYSGAVRLITLVFLIALTSNIAQAVVSSGYSVFGGMSGVNFGLLSYLWLAQRLGGPAGYKMTDPIFFFMTGYMLLSVFGIFDWLAGGNVADTAHIVGYITGMISALAIHAPRKFNNDI